MMSAKLREPPLILSQGWSMRCLADFLLDSDLCLETGASPLILNAPNNAFSLRLSNAEHDPRFPGVVLAAQLIFEAQTFDGIREIASIKLSEALNFLTYITNRKFVRKTLKRIIDWTPGLIERQALIYVETPMWDVAEPLLEKAFFESAERLMAMKSGTDQLEAMRWYRLGIQEDDIDRQFSYFWFALEIVSEFLKGAEKVPSKCPKCQEPLFCKRCDEHPIHRRYPGEAIQQTIAKVHPAGSDEIFKTLQVIRHTLLHGGRIASVVDKLPCSDKEAVTKLADVTRQAIWLTFERPEFGEQQAMTLGYSEEGIARQTLVGTAHITTTMKGGNPDDPQIENFPNVEFTVTRP